MLSPTLLVVGGCSCSDGIVFSDSYFFSVRPDGDGILQEESVYLQLNIRRGIEDQSDDFVFNRVEGDNFVDLVLMLRIPGG